MSELVDLSKLPAPDVLEVLNYEELLSQRKEKFISLYPESEQDFWRERLQLESEPIVKLLEENCYLQILERQRINDAAKATMLAYATGSDLDVIAANFNVKRLVVQAENNNVIPPLKEIKESDDDLRTRVQLAFEALSSAGPRKAYTFYALSSHGGIADVSVVSPKPAHVTVTVQSHDNHGIPTQEMINAVKIALNDEDVRPIADRVTVQAVEVFEYQVNAKLHLFRGPQTEPILKAARDNLQRYTQRTKRIGKDITRSGIYAALHVEGVQNVEILSPETDLILNDAQSAYCTQSTIETVISDEYS
jgi:baseplate J-like protein